MARHDEAPLRVEARLIVARHIAHRPIMVSEEHHARVEERAAGRIKIAVPPVYGESDGDHHEHFWRGESREDE